MSGIYGALGVSDTDRVFLSTLGQSVVYDAINKVIADYNAELNAAKSLFVEKTTSDYKIRYKLPGGGKLQRLGNQAPSAAVKTTGQWDVAFPLEGFGAALGGNRVDMAYMTAQDLDRHLKTIFIQDANTVRFEMLKSILNSAQDTFVDPHWGSLSVEPLANGDSVVFPPVLGSESEATDNHYLESGYLAASISDSNNPLVTGRDELEEHFGVVSGGSNILCFCNNAQREQLAALSDFVEVNDRFVAPGSALSLAINLPSNVPGVPIGRSNGITVVEWRWIPANYLFFLHMDAPKPLYERVDPADTGLPVGLTLVATDEEHPMESSYYEHRFGFGCANRLNGVVLELGTGGTYTVPTAYA